VKQRAHNYGWVAWLGFLLPVAIPAWAHHSFVGYDRTTTIAAEQATLKEFLWSAPHSAAVFLIQNPDGTQTQIRLTSASPPQFSKEGFKPTDFKAGDKMDITWYPAKSGKPGGMLASLKLADGRTFKDTEYFPAGSDNDKQAGAEVPK
jgi:hypothetical protein